MNMKGLSVKNQEYIDHLLDSYSSEDDSSKDIGSVNGSVIATYKNEVNTAQTLNKHTVIAKLKECNYRTPPKNIASLLDELFGSWTAKPDHWLFVAQHWNPKSINGVISRMIRQHEFGETTINNPAKYFTFLIKKRPKRKKFRGSNDTYKRQ